VLDCRPGAESTLGRRRSLRAGKGRAEVLPLSWRSPREISKDATTPPPVERPKSQLLLGRRSWSRIVDNLRIRVHRPDSIRKSIRVYRLSFCPRSQNIGPRTGRAHKTQRTGERPLKLCRERGDIVKIGDQAYVRPMAHR